MGSPRDTDWLAWCCGARSPACENAHCCVPGSPPRAPGPAVTLPQRGSGTPRNAHVPGSKGGKDPLLHGETRRAQRCLCPSLLRGGGHQAGAGAAALAGQGRRSLPWAWCCSSSSPERPRPLAHGSYARSAPPGGHRGHFTGGRPEAQGDHASPRGRTTGQRLGSRRKPQ